MEIFRITLTPYAGSLKASGRPARWNGKGTFMVYTAGSIALACLENLAHRSGVVMINDSFSITVFSIPDKLKMAVYTEKELHELSDTWFDQKQYAVTQQLGDQWLQQNNTAILKVPSAIIQTEYNYLINPRHPDSSKIKMDRVLPFTFDKRIL
ncbi:RES domain-containing protein [bacterium A37T11]|nr:RES domain-containing protein [bacterium A37T11]